MSEFLSEKDYLKILRRCQEFTSKVRLREFILFEYEKCRKQNIDFLQYVYDAANDGIPARMSEDEYNLYESSAYTNDSIKNKIETPFFVKQIVAEMQYQEMAAESLEKKNFTIQDLPSILREVNKINKSERVRYKFQKNNIDILTDWVLRLGYNGEGLEHVSGVSLAALKGLVDIYFSIPCKKEDCQIEELAFAERKKEFLFIYYRRIRKETRTEDFSRIFNEKLLRQKVNDNPRKFSSFKTLEISRWKSIQTLFGRMENEYDLILKYINYLKNLDKKRFEEVVKNNYYFGIKSEYKSDLRDLAAELTKKIHFLHPSTTPSSFSDTITAIDLPKNAPKVLFNCETTIIAYILHEINTALSPLGKFNFTRITDSGLFYIPPEKKPSDRPVIKSSEEHYNLLKRVNLKNSHGRYLSYINDADRIESKLHLTIVEILAKYLR